MIKSKFGCCLLTGMPVLAGERVSLESVQMERSSDEVPSISSGLTIQPWHASLEGFRDFRCAPVTDFQIAACMKEPG